MAIKKITKKKLSKAELGHQKRILDEISSREDDGELLGSLSSEMYLDPIDKFKAGICREIMGLKIRKGLSSKKIGELMEVDKSKASLILNCRVDSFSVDRRLSCFLKLNDIEEETDNEIYDVIHLFSSEERMG